MAVTTIIGVLGGLGLFLYGMQVMGNGLEKAAGKKLEKIIEVLTTNRVVGVLVGIVVTGVIQSSSATTVMVVGFVNAGVMKLTQAVGVIMGANVGTTITGQLVSFSLEVYAPIAVGIGVFLMMIAKEDKTKNFAQILIGFGILFIGMDFLKDALKPLREIDAFSDAMVGLSHNPFLGVLVGFLLTFMLQSSSASIGILIALASQGVLPLEAAVPILYGDNIGTCTTAMLSSIGTGRNARRAAIIHLVFNVIGTLLFIVFLTKPIMALVQNWNPSDIGRQIANTHTVFNIANVLIQLPFSFMLVKIAMWIIPNRGEDELVKATKFIDSRILETPSIALISAIKETINMAVGVKNSFENAMNAFFNEDYPLTKKTFELEVKVNTLEKEITDYLVALSNKQIADHERIVVDALFNNVNDIERIGDHAENIAELTMTGKEQGVRFTGDAKAELHDMYTRTMMTLDLAIEALETGNKEAAYNALSLEGEIDELEAACRKGHIQRLNKQECTTESGIVYLEIVNSLERISDLSAKVARISVDVIAV
ncbi:MAG: Na/Pi cotransporter family protein [Vallitaleaceae bacterium]|jgi:phosphate:Na+ symporter|nr:Na/Pi cotransporter family protein [Vallitaleaceae bacterium]